MTDQKTVSEQLAVIRRGTVDIIAEAELADRLAQSVRTGRPLRIKYGIDPTAPEMHLGHAVPIRKLRDFQRFGHQVVFLVGDFTALVGDPTGRSETRPMLSAADIRRNLASYRRQAGRILDLARTEFVHNADWLGRLDFREIIRAAGSFTVAQMLERDDFSRRYRAGNAISLQEFLYPLMQGYDSVALKCDVEIGATEQTFNLLAGRTLQEAYGQPKQVVVTLPVLEGTDGVRKMSKSYGNFIPLDAPPNEMYGALMSIPDPLTAKYFRCLTDVTEELLAGLLAGHPRAAKAELARRVTAFFHGPEAAEAAAAGFDRVFRRGDAPGDEALARPPVSFQRPPGLREIVDHLVAAGEFSRAEVKRQLKQGALSINGEKVSSLDQALPVADSYLVRVGRRRFYKWVRSGQPPPAATGEGHDG